MNKKIILSLFLWVFLTPNCLFAQINESDTSKFQLYTSFTGNYQTGNVEILTLRGRFDFTYTPVKGLVFKSQNSSLYQDFYRVKADNDIFSRNYLYLKPQNRVYPYLIAFMSTNYRRKIDLRYFAGIGLTWQVLRLRNHIIKLSANTVYERTNFKDTVYNFSEYNGSNQINLWRVTAYLSGWDWFFNRRLRFAYEAYFQPALDNGHNYRTQIYAALDFPLWKGLAFTTTYIYTQENVVINHIKSKDNILTFGLNYSLKIKMRD